MKTRSLCSILLICAGFAFFSTSCADDSVATDESLSLTATDESQAASLGDAVINEAEMYANTLADLGYNDAMAVKGNAEVLKPTIIVNKKDSVSFPKQITIDYGTGIIVRGDTLKGQIIITITDKLWKPGATKTVKLVNFYVNSNNIKGIKIITTNALNTAKNPSVTVVVSDTIIRADKSTIIRNSTRTRERISDNGTPKNFSDDKFSITGNGNGVNAKKVVYTVEITKPLIIYNDFRFFVSGTVTTKIKDKTIVLDYGDGTKDNKATITVNGVTKEMTLKN